MMRAAVLRSRARELCSVLRVRALSSSARTQFPDLDVEFDIVGQNREGRAIYLDSQATTPLDPRVLDAMMPYMTGMYGNPHSKTHAYGWESNEAVEAAREQVAALIGAEGKEVVFTSG